MVNPPRAGQSADAIEAEVAAAPLAGIESRILLVRGQRVLLDADLARLYGVATGRLNEQVRRNRGRFPADFMFQLTKQEVVVLRSQSAISQTASGRGGRRYAPLAFTEHGAIMAATVLSSDRAIAMSLHVVRAFVRLRDIVAANRALAAKLEELERRPDTHDQAIDDIIQAIRDLARTPEPEPAEKRRIGFIQSD